MDCDSLREIFAEAFDLKPQAVTEDSNPDTVEAWDSFGHMKLITAVESALKIQFQMSEIIAIDSFDSLCRISAEASKR